LRAYQRVLPELSSLGARLAAISPMLPDGSLSVAETNRLEFHVLSDIGNRVAREYGLAYELDDALRGVYTGPLAVDLPAHNGDASWELPVTATFVIDPGGVIRLAFVDPDYTRRLEPGAILEALAAITGREIPPEGGACS
jgi:peroxiredoxin